MRPPRPPANSALRSMWPKRVVLSLRVYGVAWWVLQNVNALCYSWTAVSTATFLLLSNTTKATKVGDTGKREAQRS